MVDGEHKCSGGDKFRHYCVTFYDEPDHALLDDVKDTVRYFISGREVCPETQRVHWQAYLEYVSPQRWDRIKRIFADDTPHIERRRGPRVAARDYCKKDGHFLEWGVWHEDRRGARSDLQEAITAVFEEKISEDNFLIEHCTVAARYRSYSASLFNLRKKRKVGNVFRNVRCEIFWGATGTGKTRKAFELGIAHEGGFFFGPMQSNGSIWWTGYTEQDLLIIDDFDCTIPLVKLLRWIDGYPCIVGVHCSTTLLCFTHVIITSNIDPEEWYLTARPAHRDALFRRVTNIEHMQ